TILEVGDSAVVFAHAGAETKLLDLHGAFLMPGFIEGHGHFSGLGGSLMNLNFLRSKSWDEIVAMVAEKAKTAEPGEWITGRGWHQEKWATPPADLDQGYPTNRALNERFPDLPVILDHASGHAMIVNARALEMAGITRETPDPEGGRIIRDANGQPTGVLEENAMDPINRMVMSIREKQSENEKEAHLRSAIQLAEQECLSRGITSFQDAGSSRATLDYLKKMTTEDELAIRVWAMLLTPPSRLERDIRGLPWISYGDDHLTVRAIKIYMDGALGSHGAWLLEPYADEPDYSGQPVTQTDTVVWMAQVAKDHDLQLCAHAIGDRANREFLDMCDSLFHRNGHAPDHRWRIEHAQHLDTADIPRFAELGVIPSMQAIHCISDAPFVVKRLGEDRARQGAYVWRSLIDSGARLTNGTDAPVESLDPMRNLYAAVTRRRLDNGEPFFPEQVLTRQEAIHTYTLANAYAAFQEKDLGTLSPGKWADFIILDKDLLTCSLEEIPGTKVLQTIIGGKVVYDRSVPRPK
ncbi:MAG: amidohydrolase, partial [Saprospiraceae bacterium]|nr:amidohydrolase [Saprospiraceae bacterium]